MVLRDDSTSTPGGLPEELIALVRERIGPVVSFREVCIVPKLPKTRSGKILRATIRAIADGDTLLVPATIEDARVLSLLEKLLHPERFFGPKVTKVERRVKAIVVEKDQPARLTNFDPAGLMPGEITIGVSHSTLNYKDGLALTGKAPSCGGFP